MRKLVVSTALVASLTILAGCGGTDSATTPTEEENLQLDNAAEMLDANTLDASPDSMVADESAPLGNGEEAVADEPASNDAAANSAANAQ